MRPTPMTEKIIRLHREAMHKLATPANELALQAAVENLERERAELIEALRELHNQFDGMAEYQKEQEYSEAEMVQMFQVIANRARALLSRMGAA